jgi:small conductance mechanosensitive channel
MRYGGIEVAPVLSPIDNRVLFNIASPTILDRSDNDAGTPVEQRAQEVRDRLKLAIFNREMNPESLAVEVSRLNNVTIIDVRDEAYPRPLVLVSVTEQDADFNGLPIDALAEDWRRIFDDEMRQGSLQTTKEAWLRSIGNFFKIFLALLGVTAIVWLLKRLISKHQKVLRQRQKALKQAQPPKASDEPYQSQDESSPESEAEVLSQQRNQFVKRFQEILNLDRRLGLLSLAQWFLFWLFIIAWYFGSFELAEQLPGLSAFSGYVLEKPLQLLAVWFFTGLAIRLSRRIIDRFQDTWQRQGFGSLIDLGDAQRRKLRVSTIAGSVKGLVTILIATTGLLAVLKILGVPTGSVLAIGGLLGLAVSFGSQNLVKDLVNGFLILVEDQYAIGDVIDLGQTSGLVENLNLRVTQRRSSDGSLVTIPNSAITQVKNQTRSWSRVNFSIDVAYQTDPLKALRVLREVAQTMYNDPAWHDKMLTAPEVLGIDSVSHSGMTITTWIQTVPGQQWVVGREFRLRVGGPWPPAALRLVFPKPMR